MPRFCHDCTEKDNCQHDHNLKKCSYYKEVKSNV
jgi:hypothetical protein